LVYLSDHFFGYAYCSSFFCMCMPFIIYWLFKKLRSEDIKILSEEYE